MRNKKMKEEDFEDYLRSYKQVFEDYSNGLYTMEETESRLLKLLEEKPLDDVADYMVEDGESMKKKIFVINIGFTKRPKDIIEDILPLLGGGLGKNAANKLTLEEKLK
jgi:hypothetical protein